MKLSITEQTIYGLLKMVGSRGLMVATDGSNTLHTVYDQLVAKGLAACKRVSSVCNLYTLVER